ncbi:hypothetical protein B0A81_08740 [Flavobacterium plurextorum]|uniref:histidine kinase n=1 Tax=Flavobacterium plurextorum TaxID=1114867 RepID=A0ABX4CW36_9FLAO|nr:PAS domain-containing sensor histidine kinase [Flavobacterium plurextorum]OXB08395.1 hypothetical protein B0A81_08740 [Flavobacterium plurextorum]
MRNKIANNNFEMGLQSFGMGVWHWDIIMNTVFFSAESLKIIELESDDIIDDWDMWYKLVHPDDLEMYSAFILRCFDTEVSIYEHCYRVLTNSGNYKWIIDKAQVIARDKEGKPLRVTGVYTDVYFQTEKELELEKIIKHHDEQNKLLLNFTHIVSHNLKSHIGNIKLLLDVHDLIKDSNPLETLENIRIVSNDLNDTIAHLSEVVSIQNNTSINVKSLDLGEFLKKILVVIAPQINEKSVTIINNVAIGSQVIFNPAYLESVLLNLTTNAIKYASPERVPIVKFDFFIENQKKVFTVTDNGLGIDLKKYGAVLFDIFKTFHAADHSSGLGLHMVKNQIDAMNGKLEVNSKVGHGSCFKIIFKE